jgi:acetylornithine/N-succinyldiaminopimelate aminotransferase
MNVPSSKGDLLKATALANDPRVIEGKKLFLAALKDHQQHCTTIRPPDPALKRSYHELIALFNQWRGGNLYYPFIGSGFGHGALVELLDGSIKYDMISGIGSHYLGHNHPILVNSSLDAALSDTIMQGNLQQNSDAVKLCELLINTSKMDHCILSSSGAMANENALKIAFQKKSPANRVLAFDHCFAGRTLALSQITDKPSYREGLPANLSVDYIPFFNYQEPEESIYQSTKMLKMHLERYPKQHAVLFCELVQGEGGLYPGSQLFFQSILQIAREHNIVIIFDEVQTFGRTPELFAFQHFNLGEYADIVTIGKVSQVCSTLYKNELKPRQGLISQTFISSTSAIQASIAIIQHLLDEGFFGPIGKIVKIHQAFVSHFEKLNKKYPGHLSDPYGIGTMIAFTPFDGELKRTAKIAQDLFEEGVIVFTAGSHPSRIRLLPPAGALTMEDIDQVMHIIETVLKTHLTQREHSLE